MTQQMLDITGFTFNLYNNDGPYNDWTDLVEDLDKNELTNDNSKENAPQIQVKEKKQKKT